MKNSLIAGLRGSIVILLLTLGCIGAIRLYKTAVPQQVEHDTTNITQRDYAQERAKWESQNVSVYEITASDPLLRARMRVDRATGDIFLLQVTARGEPESVDGLNMPISGVTAAVFKPYTIDALYDAIGDALTGASVGNSSTNSVSSADSTTNFRDYEVQFDPNRGYPVRFMEGLRTTLSAQEITWRTNVKDVQIKDFTIIR